MTTKPLDLVPRSEWDNETVNKCDDCCPVRGCEVCGPCSEHDPTAYDNLAKALYPNSNTKPSEDIRPGDILMFMGHPHLVDHIKPYDFMGSCGIAKAADGWGITLFPGHPVEVA